MDPASWIAVFTGAFAAIWAGPWVGLKTKGGKRPEGRGRWSV